MFYLTFLSFFNVTHKQWSQTYTLCLRKNWMTPDFLFLLYKNSVVISIYLEVKL